MSETVMGVWSSLVKLAGTATNIANMPSPLLQSATPFAALIHGTDGTKPFFVLYSNTTHLPFLLDTLTINVTVLRQQQIRLGLLKAARVLFSRQENLRQIMARPVNTKESEDSLFQQLLSAATIPSPVKAMFGRDELEVMLIEHAC